MGHEQRFAPYALAAIVSVCPSAASAQPVEAIDALRISAASSRDIKVSLDQELTIHVTVTDNDARINYYFWRPNGGAFTEVEMGPGWEAYHLIQRYNPSHIWEVFSNRKNTYMLSTLRRSQNLGATWESSQTISTPGYSYHEGAVSCNQVDDCMFLALAEIRSGLTFQPTASHWNGKKWSDPVAILTSDTTSEVALPTGIVNQYRVYYVDQSCLEFVLVPGGQGNLRSRLITFDAHGTANWDSPESAATDTQVIMSIRNPGVNLWSLPPFGAGAFAYAGVSWGIVAGVSPAGERWAWNSARHRRVDVHHKILVQHGVSAMSWDPDPGEVSDPQHDLVAASIAYDVVRNEFYLFYYKITGAVPDNEDAPNGTYDVCYRKVVSGAGSKVFETAPEYCPLTDLKGKWLGAAVTEVMGDGSGYFVGAVHDGNMAITYEDGCEENSPNCTLSVYRNF